MSIPIVGLSSMATSRLLTDLVASWTAEGGAHVSIDSMGGVDAAARVECGAALDIAFLAADAMAKLAAAGHVVASSQTALANSPVAIAVPKGTPPPAIDTEIALRETVLSAQSIGYSTGPSGVALQKLFERWGIADAVRARLVKAPPGVAVGTLLVQGRAQLGFQQLSELMHLEGIEVLGPMPRELQIITTFVGAVCATSTQPIAGLAFLRYTQSSAAEHAKRRHGMLAI